MCVLIKKGLLSKNVFIGKLIIRESFYLIIKKCVILIRRVCFFVVK